MTLNDFGFPSKIIDLIINCIMNTLSLKWNNEILDNFSPKRAQTRGLFILLPTPLYGEVSLAYSNGNANNQL